MLLIILTFWGINTEAAQFNKSCFDAIQLNSSLKKIKQLESQQRIGNCEIIAKRDENHSSYSLKIANRNIIQNLSLDGIGDELVEVACQGKCGI